MKSTSSFLFIFLEIIYTFSTRKRSCLKQLMKMETVLLAWTSWLHFLSFSKKSMFTWYHTVVYYFCSITNPFCCPKFLNIIDVTLSCYRLHILRFFSFKLFFYCREPLINCCPVCGERLEISDKLNSVIHMSLCFDEGTGNQIMTGGFLTDSQASYGWAWDCFHS